MRKARKRNKQTKFHAKPRMLKLSQNTNSYGIFRNSEKNRCARCGGFMVIEYCLDLSDDSGKFTFSAWRCIQCGELIDPIILKNRRNRPNRRQIERKDSVIYLNNIDRDDEGEP